jgi:hypothetical protein
VQHHKGFLGVIRVIVVIDCYKGNEKSQTSNIVGELKGWDAIFNVNIEYIIVFFAFIKLFSTGAYGIDDIADLDPS